jgi:hypothetical protein
MAAESEASFHEYGGYVIKEFIAESGHARRAVTDYAV